MLYAVLALSFIVSAGALFLAIRDHRKLSKENRELRLRAELAERNLRHLGDLASEVAHEIKNPLTAILCSAETLNLMLADQLEEVHQKSLKYMKDYGDYLLRLVSDFLDLSQAETGRLQVKRERIQLGKTCQSVVGLLQAQANEKNVSLSCSIDDDTLITFDPKHVKQIIFNLVHNAIKFTPIGGQVLIQVSKDIPGRKVRVAVSDTGVGIHQDRLDSVFEPYWSAPHASEEEKKAGSGLGLSLCKALAMSNGSDLFVKSKVGTGTTFWFFAEILEDVGSSADRRRSSVATQVSPLVGQRFLVIEANDGIADSVSQLITAWGGMVDSVETATDAVSALAYEDYDAVMVEGVSGDGLFPNEIVDLVKEHRKTEETSVIVTAASEGQETGADCQIEKPYSGKTLLHSLLNTGKYSVTH